MINYLTPRAAAAYTGLSQQTLDLMFDAGKIDGSVNQFGDKFYAVDSLTVFRRQTKVTILLSPETTARLIDYAKDKDKTVNDIAEDIVNEFLDNSFID